MKNKKNNAQYQLTNRFVKILLLLLIVINLAFIGISLISSYRYLNNQAAEIMNTLQEVPQDTSEWTTLVNATTAKDDEDAVRILLENGPMYYSKEGKEIFDKLAQGRALLLFPGIILSENKIYLYQKQEQAGRTVELAVHGTQIVELMVRMFLISLLLNILAIVIGSLVIYLFVGKWSKTLHQMTKEMSEIETDEKQDLHLSVPSSPNEFRQVATSFNHLLDMQRNATKRESQFVADASHELRTPLSAIRGHVQLIKRRGSQHPEVIGPSIDFIDKESKRLEILMNQLLALGRSTVEKPLSLISLSKVIQQTAEEFRRTSKQEVTLAIEPGIQMQIDELEIQQVCQNLFENAAKYSHASDTITITLTKIADKIRLSVADTGPGIPDDMKERIFERFYRIDHSRSSQVEGSGIGLSIVQSIVEKYHGAIQVRDNQPTGSIFQIDFPLK